jgi:hypothetical protein
MGISPGNTALGTFLRRPWRSRQAVLDCPLRNRGDRLKSRERAIPTAPQARISLVIHFAVGISGTAAQRWLQEASDVLDSMFRQIPVASSPGQPLTEQR